jgi:endonuclease/exonuclease/phosphatase family metal-dependent hydrolase
MRFRMITYNIHKAIGVDRQFRPQRIIDVLRHYEADIVLLQEVDRGVPRSDHLDLAAELAGALRYDFKSVGMNVTLKKGHYGNATLTRFPIGRQRNINLTVPGHKARGAQHTIIYLPTPRRATPIHIFNIHLGLRARERRKQVRLLLSTTDVDHLPEERGCIIAGDMNDWRGVLKRRHFSPAGFACATNRRPGSPWSIKTFPSYAPAGGLDKIFFRGGLLLTHVHRARMALARVASDHLPVIADFEVL